MVNYRLAVNRPRKMMRIHRRAKIPRADAEDSTR
jgi:hypothetical protein